MNQIDALIRFGYALVIVTMILMIWASLARANEFDTNNHSPCLFSPLCTCSKVSPNDLGIIQCRSVPYPALPKAVNNSKVFMLKMERTGLYYLQPNFLQGTGLYRIEIAYNPLGEVPESAFDGLERSLWELSIHHNQLVEVPSRALRNLKKLKYLDLSGNQIDCIESDSFSGLKNSLERLILADNSIDSLPRDAFSSLPKLDTIDLSGNNLAYLEPNLFQDGMPALSKVLLGNNVFTKIPYAAISSLKSLHILDLSHNVIGSIRTENGTSVSPRLALDILHLEFNRIGDILTASFSNFDVVNVTYLDGNPLKTLGDRAFESARIRELYIRHCGLSFVSPASFEGMGNSLQVLDMSGNNLTALPTDFLKGFNEFRTLNLKDNKFQDVKMVEMLSFVPPTVEKIDLSGQYNAAINLKNINKFNVLRALSLGTLTTNKLAPEDFQDFGVELEDLKITRSSIDSIKSHAFKYVRGVRRIDIGHSLISLKISHGFDKSFSTFPSQSFRTLTSLQELDLSNNQLKSISDTSFHFLQNLKAVELNDNAIERISKGTFQGEIHSKLETLALHFNSIKKIEENTFADLKELINLQLDDNRITKIEKRAFMNLKKLKYLTIRGNKVDMVSDEAFQQTHSAMTEIRINQNLCRLCGCKNENGQIFSGENGAELLLKVQETFSMLICGNDPLPHSICIQCEQDVNVFYMKIKRFRSLDKKWLDEVHKSQPDHPYLDLHRNMQDEIHRIREQLQEILPEKTQESTEPEVDNDIDKIEVETEDTMTSTVTDDTISCSPVFDMKELEKRNRDRLNREKRKRFQGYVRSRKLKRKIKGSKSGEQVINPISIDAMNKSTSPNSLPYKRYRSEILEIMSQNAILKHRTRVNRRASQPFDYSNLTNYAQNIPNKRLNESLPTVIKEERRDSNESKSVQVKLETSGRCKRRINYSEDLVDEAFMYEQILQDKQHQQEKRKKSLPKLSQKSPESTSSAASTSENIDSRLRLLEQCNEISIMPMKLRVASREKSNEGKMCNSVKQEPLFNITSSVSVHIKPRKSEQLSDIQISNITSLYGCQNSPPKEHPRITCTYCHQIFPDDNSLAIHQCQCHLTISAFKIDAKRMLHPKLRRGRMLNVNDEQFIRCVNCWKLHPNNKSILDHWNGGGCLLYCPVCGKTFHDNIKEMDMHVETEHGVQLEKILEYTLPTEESSSSPEPIRNVKVIKQEVKPVTISQVTTTDTVTEQRSNSPAEFICTECNRTFASRRALSCHQYAKHKENERCDSDIKAENPLNPFALLSQLTTTSKNEKSINKKWKRSNNGAVLKTAIGPRKSLKISQRKKRIPSISATTNSTNSVSTKAFETNSSQVQINATPASVQNTHETEVSQDQTVSSSYLSAITINANDCDKLQIKPEPNEEFLNDYVEVPAQACNGWSNYTASYNEWDCVNENVIESYNDTSPRLKIKDLNDLQETRQPYRAAPSVSYTQNPSPYKQHSVIVSNQNISGLQIQNVQSYQVHSVPSVTTELPLQPQPQLHIQPQSQMQQQQQCEIVYQQQQQQHFVQQQPHHRTIPQQPYVDFNSCMSGSSPMDTNNANLNSNEHGMCTTNDLYQMHITQPQQPLIQTNSLINPVYILPRNSTHSISEYHY